MLAPVAPSDSHDIASAAVFGEDPVDAGMASTAPDTNLDIEGFDTCPGSTCGTHDAVGAATSDGMWIHRCTPDARAPIEVVDVRHTSKASPSTEARSATPIGSCRTVSPAAQGLLRTEGPIFESPLRVGNLWALQQQQQHQQQYEQQRARRLGPGWPPAPLQDMVARALEERGPLVNHLRKELHDLEATLRREGDQSFYHLSAPFSPEIGPGDVAAARSSTAPSSVPSTSAGVGIGASSIAGLTGVESVGAESESAQYGSCAVLGRGDAAELRWLRGFVSSVARVPRLGTTAAACARFVVPARPVFVARSSGVRPFAPWRRTQP